MKIKNLFVLFVISAVIMLAGCEQKETITKKDPYLGGTAGLALEFMEGAPPAEVYDKGTFPFDISVKIENQGEHKVTKDKVTLKIAGLNPAEFNNPVMAKSPDEDLDAKYLDPEGKEQPGGLIYVTFPSFNYMSALTANVQYPIRAEVCYEYGTSGQANLCVKQDVLSTVEAVCKINEAKKTFSSGSPVQISGFEETAAGKNKITFSFVIEHKGAGEISKINTQCSNSNADKNKVFLEVSAGNLQGLSCTGLEEGTGSSGYVRLESGKRTVRCTLSTDGVTSDFEQQANINLKFSYKEHTERQLLIKHSS